MSPMLESFIQWQKERPSRRVNIEISDGVTIWVYDTSLMAGQYVTDVREIDLEAKREERERREFERLSAKFGKGETDEKDHHAASAVADSQLSERVSSTQRPADERGTSETVERNDSGGGIGGKDV